MEGNVVEGQFWEKGEVCFTAHPTHLEYDSVFKCKSVGDWVFEGRTTIKDDALIYELGPQPVNTREKDSPNRRHRSL